MQQNTANNNHEWNAVETLDGMILSSYGEGIPLVVFPGLEGSGESCLHFILPAISELELKGIKVKVFLVNYAGGRSDSLSELAETAEKMLVNVIDDAELLVFSQSFGNLITAQIALRGKLLIKRMFMISPFYKLPGLLVPISTFSTLITPTFLFRLSIGPLGKYVFGPIGEEGKNHPFFDALKKSTSKQIGHQLKWLKGLNYYNVFAQIKQPVKIALGQKDRLVNIKQQISYFESLYLERDDWKFIVRKENGHVIFLKKEVDFAKNEMMQFVAPSMK